MKGHAKHCVVRHCELAPKKVSQLKQAATLCIDDHQSKSADSDIVGELATVCAHIVIRCLYIGRLGRPDILWTVNTLARAVAKWNRVRGERLAR